MLTVLIRYNKTRRECLFTAKSVEYQPDNGSHADSGLLINYDDVHSTHLGFTEPGDEDWRDVFVMNKAGQTVARYML